ncbi:MAG: hypothetical protein V1815_01650 [Candidatus Woesearchaeota archaeon]
MKRGALESSELGKLLIGLALLVVVILFILALKNKDYSLLAKIKEIVRIG